MKGPSVRDAREIDPETGRYIGYSPRTRKALEAIGDIKQMLERRKMARANIKVTQNID